MVRLDGNLVQLGGVLAEVSGLLLVAINDSLVSGFFVSLRPVYTPSTHLYMRMWRLVQEQAHHGCACGEEGQLS